MPLERIQFCVFTAAIGIVFVLCRTQSIPIHVYWSESSSHCFLAHRHPQRHIPLCSRYTAGWLVAVLVAAS